MSMHVELGLWENWLRETSPHSKAYGERIIAALELLCKAEGLLKPIHPLVLEQRQWFVIKRDPLTYFSTQEEAEECARKLGRKNIYWQYAHKRKAHQRAVRYPLTPKPQTPTTSAYSILPTTWDHEKEAEEYAINQEPWR